MPGHIFDLRERKTQPYNGPRPFQARWRSPLDPRERRNQSFATKREAKQWMSEQDADVMRGTWTDPFLGRKTLAAIADDWMEANRRRIGPKTREGYWNMLGNHVKPKFGERRVSAIDAADIQKWLNELSERLSPTTVRNVATILHAVLDHAVLRKYIPVNACSAVRVPTAKRQHNVNPLPHQELARLADAMPTAQDRAAILVAGYCGLRANEIWALRNNDVTLKRLRVDEKITEAKVGEREPGYTLLPNGLAVGPTKTYSAAPVALPAIVQEALAVIIDPDAEPDSFIFRDSLGGAVRHTNWSKRVFIPVARKVFPEWTRQAEQRVIAKAKRIGRSEPTAKQLARVGPIRFHDLRHTCAAYLIEAGVHPKVIQMQMRHKSITTTMDIYGHLFSDGLDAVADALDARSRRAAEQPPAPAVVQNIR